MGSLKFETDPLFGQTPPDFFDTPERPPFIPLMIPASPSYKPTGPMLMPAPSGRSIKPSRSIVKATLEPVADPLPPPPQPTPAPLIPASKGRGVPKQQTAKEMKRLQAEHKQLHEQLVSDAANLKHIERIGRGTKAVRAAYKERADAARGNIQRLEERIKARA